MALARFFIPHLLISLCAICLHNGGWWPWTFFLGLSVLVTIGDRLCPRDHADLQGVNPRAANALLFAIWPLLIALVALVIVSVAVGIQQVTLPLLGAGYAERWNYTPLQAYWALCSAWVCS